jgi:hypothetical protein
MSLVVFVHLFNWIKFSFVKPLKKTLDRRGNAQNSGDTSSYISVYAFTLIAWPKLGDKFKTANIYRVLSVMSTKPVSWDWMFVSLGNNHALTISLLQQLELQKVLKVMQMHYEPCAFDLEKVIDQELKNASMRDSHRLPRKSTF